MRSALIYGFLVAIATWKVFSMPIHSFDSYYYSYLASPDLIDFKNIPDLPHEYVVMSAESYVQQRPYYTVKILYVALVRLSARLVGAMRAPHLVSVVSYFFLAWSVCLWLRSFGVSEGWTTLASIAIMFSSVATDTARMGTPDLLCTLLLVTGAWLLLSSPYPVPGALLLALSVLGRQDSLILAGLLLVLAYLRGRITLAVGVAACVVMLACDIAVTRGSYPYHQLLAWTLRTSYWHALSHNIAKTEVAIYCPFLLVAFAAIKYRFQTGLVIVCACSLVVRYVLMPNWEIRYLLPQALIVAVVGAALILGGKLVCAEPAM